MSDSIHSVHLDEGRTQHVLSKKASCQSMKTAIRRSCAAPVTTRRSRSPTAVSMEKLQPWTPGRQFVLVVSGMATCIVIPYGRVAASSSHSPATRSLIFRTRSFQLKLALRTASLVAGVILLSASSATASVGVGLRVPGTVDRGKSLTFTYNSHGVSPGTGLALQKTQGSRRVWRTQRRLSGTSGSYRIARVKLDRGIHKYRVIAYRKDHGKTTILASSTRRLAVYARISFARLFSRAASTYTVSRDWGTFTYVNNWFGTFEMLVSARANTCRLVHVIFIAQNSNTRWGSAVASVVQETRDPVRAVYAADSRPASITARLQPGTSWSVRSDNDIYANGWASCR